MIETAQEFSALCNYSTALKVKGWLFVSELCFSIIARFVFPGVSLKGEKRNGLEPFEFPTRKWRRSGFPDSEGSCSLWRGLGRRVSAGEARREDTAGR